MTSQPFRQIHLDFHTSQQIVNVGGEFDPHQFAETLAKAHVNSINCFARCHHGYIYFDTKRHPERRHPYLQRNLLKEQIEACHAVGIRVPIYTTIQWDFFTGREHPEWLAVDADGRIQGPGPYEAGFRQNLLVNTPYFDFLKDHVEELFESVPVDGLWFDIVKPLDDSSVWAKQQMIEQGLDPADEKARQLFGLQIIDQFKAEMSAYVRTFSDDCSIFYNEGHISPSILPTKSAYTQLEIESIPSGEWGYIHFPITARYARTLDVPYLGMTGKFHTEWGDFHSLKNLEALEFECFQMLALGAQCSVGDQLHPNGILDGPTYDLIGKVFEQVEAKEAWCDNVTPVVEIGVMLPKSFGAEDTPPSSSPHGRIPRSSAGICQMLMADSFQFDFISGKTDFDKYKVIVLTDDVMLDESTAQKLEAFVNDGGKLIASYRGGLLEDTDTFPDFFGVSFEGDAPFNPDFVTPKGFIADGLHDSEYVMYVRGAQVKANDGATTIATVTRPYFNRTHEHFMSHRHAPSTGEVVYPAVIENGNVIYFAHPIFTQYRFRATSWTRTMLRNTLTYLLDKQLVTHNGPSTLNVTINQQEQGDTSRWVTHLLHYIPIRRSETIDVIEDVIPLFDLELNIQVSDGVQTVKLVPEDTELEFEAVDGELRFCVDKLHGHQMISIEFE